MSLNKPIIIIGAARSGTTMLGNILAMHPDIAYLEEPNVIWKYKNAYKKIDIFTEKDATNDIIYYINNFFSKFLKNKNKIRLLEKTPSNTLRLSFVRKIFPKSKVIVVIRDGRNVAVSARKKWLYEEDKNTEKLKKNISHKKQHFKQQIKKFLQTPFFDKPYYIKEIFFEILFHLGLKKRMVWGPKIPGIYDLVKTLSPIEVCAMQWKFCVEYTYTQYLLDKNKEDFIFIRYEDFLEDPKRDLEKILNHCELEIPDNFSAMYKKIQNMNIEVWKKELNNNEIKKVSLIMNDLLLKHGYLYEK